MAPVSAREDLCTSKEAVIRQEGQRKLVTKPTPNKPLERTLGGEDFVGAYR
jgi:hypothetical protein